MTLYYNLTFALLVFEMALFIVLILPLPGSWRRAMFRVISTSPIVAKAQYFLKIIFIFVFVLFLDAVNRASKVQSEHDSAAEMGGAAGTMAARNMQVDSSLAARKFYAQRNIYLTGFTLFLSLILNRTYSLILEILRSEEKLAALEATAVGQGGSANIPNDSALQVEIAELRKKLAESTSQERDFETLKKQSKQQADEYNRLADKHNELERSLSGEKVLKKDL
ncbi:hypothetical protein BZG36_00077 [Bifiguratus adelaidae]|uniref:Endoplasmic reticulum transmembrane protein n=1 Tax=Bifiguratus adelaidae TaxID=1938954 RepID=A0A261Y918_9FUNG|nr:hypothetical protein BZG36_00077 [Bifiguratus adelaidae]